jgi:hypothetical protein
MPEITSVLERAAATPTREPEVDRAYTRGRRRKAARSLAVAAACIVVLVAVVAVVTTGSAPSRVQVKSAPAPLPTPHAATSADATIDVAPGWTTSSEPLEWWLTSPFELFSISTSPLPASRHDVGNDAACPSEIPAAAVDNLPPDGAYLWIGEWSGGLYQTAPRPPTFSGVAMNAACPLPRGEQAFTATYRDRARDFTVNYVLGPDAPASRRTDIDQMLNSLRFH